jgi:hypothetical protein
MPKVWKVLVRTERTDENPQQAEWFLVAANDQDAAVRTLRTWRDFFGAHELRVIGEADQRLVAWAGATNIALGEVCAVTTLS